MFYTVETDDKIMISKNDIVVVSKTKETEKILELEKSKNKLKEVIEDARHRKSFIKNELRSRRDISYLGAGFSVVMMGGLDIGSFLSYFFGSLKDAPAKENIVPVLVVTNLVFGTTLYKCAKRAIKLEKQGENVKVEFSQIARVIENEIKREDEEQRRIAMDDLSATACYLKIKSL